MIDEARSTVAAEVRKEKMMDQQAEIESYNYRDFVGSDFLPFRTHLPVGSSAPDFQAILMETGRAVRLSDYWKRHDLVVEFGSLT